MDRKKRGEAATFPTRTGDKNVAALFLVRACFPSGRQCRIEGLALGREERKAAGDKEDDMNASRFDAFRLGLPLLQDLDASDIISGPKTTIGKNMKNYGVIIALLFAAALSLLSGCAGSSSHMKEVSASGVNIAPMKREASVVFMRPSGFDFAIDSSVFDIGGDTDNFIGIVSAKKKIVYKTHPGPHMFMVIGESADFMQADLQAGKIYYALVTPRMGVWKGRFSLRPVTRFELSSQEFKDWADSCTYTENTDSSLNWAKENAPSIQAKKTRYLPEWQGKADGEKPYLKAKDCL